MLPPSNYSISSCIFYIFYFFTMCLKILNSWYLKQLVFTLKLSQFSWVWYLFCEYALSIIIVIFSFNYSALRIEQWFDKVMIICRHETWNNISTPLLQEICQHKCQHDKRLAINLQGQVFHLWVRLKVCKYHR